MPGLDKFKKPTAASPSKQAGATKRVNPWAGITSAQPKDPMPHVGLYQFKVVDVSAGHNPGKGTDSFKITLEIVDLEKPNEFHDVGDQVFIPFLVSGKSMNAGKARAKAFVVAAAGYEGDEDFKAFDPDDLFIPALLGESNDYSGVASLTGRLVNCLVTRGNTRDDGQDYYREFQWFVVPEEEQEVARPEAA